MRTDRKKRAPQGLYTLPLETQQELAARCATTETLDSIVRWLAEKHGHKTTGQSVSRFRIDWEKRSPPPEFPEAPLATIAGELYKLCAKLHSVSPPAAIQLQSAGFEALIVAGKSARGQ
jgi:hypothetical protein